MRLIIKEGNPAALRPKENPIVLFTCSVCDCEFSSDASTYEYMAEKSVLGNTSYTSDCPFCNNPVTVVRPNKL